MTTAPSEGGAKGGRKAADRRVIPIARCNCSGQTCSCAIRPTPGGGLEVTGLGSGSSPYLIGLEDTGNPALTELSDIKPGETLISGDLPIWNGTGWEFKHSTRGTTHARDYGVVGDGVANDAAALQAAATAAAAAGTKFVASGTFRINSTVTITSEADLSTAVFTYFGSGVAVSVGVVGSATQRKSVQLPRVVNGTKTGNGWAQTNVVGTVGVLIQNCSNVDVVIPHIQNFETGLRVAGFGTGTAYCDFNLGHLDNNKRNLHLTANSTGWSNQNNYFGGRLSHNSNEGTVVAGTRHILIDTTTFKVNGNDFYNTSIESPNLVEFALDCGGVDNIWWGCRWENTGANPRVNWQDNAIGNVIMYGYNSQSIAETRGANTYNHLHSRDRARMAGNGGPSSNAILALENRGSSANPALRVMEAGAEAANTDQNTGWAVELTSQSLKGKRAIDTQDRLRLDLVNGRVYVGAGSVATTRYFGNFGAASMGFDGSSVGFITDNTNDFGMTSARPRYIRAGTAVQPGQFTTATRPAAATAGIGAVIYDTTLSKPVWSNGTVWKDSAGTTV